MKKVLFVLMMFVAPFCWGQQFDGVSISGSPASMINAYKAKGYYFVKTLNPTCNIMKGMFMGDLVELYINSTPKTNVVYKLTVFFPKENSWMNLKRFFNKVFGILNNKYGQYDSLYDYFDKPYYEGDGYEISAITLEKCHYSAFWLNRGNTSIGLYISQWKQIQIDYENDENARLREREVNSIETKSF